MDQPKQRHQSTGWLYCRQLCALLWKSFIIRRVHYFSTFFELIAPLFLTILIAFLYAQGSGDGGSDSDGGQKANATLGPIYYQNPWTDANIDFNLNDFYYLNFQLFYTPNNDIVNEYIEYIQAKLNGSESSHFITRIEYIQCDNESDLVVKMNAAIKKDDIFYDDAIGIVFFDTEHDQTNDDESVNINLNSTSTSWYYRTGQLRYRIRSPLDMLQTSLLKQAYPVKFNQEPQNTKGLKPTSMEMYVMFTKIMAYIDQAYIERVCDEFGTCSQIHKPHALRVNQMPYPRYRNPRISQISIYDFIGLLILLSYVLVTPLIVKRISDEKSTKMKELLRLIGMSDFMFWCSHLINYLIIIVIHAIYITLILFCWSVPLFVTTSWVLFFITFILFGIQMILFAMLLTTLFNRPVIGTIVTILIWCTCSTVIWRFLVPSLQTNGDEVTAKNSARIGTSFLPFGSIIWFISIAGVWENSFVGGGGEGLNFSTIASSTLLYGDFTVLTVWLCILASYVLYAFFIWYLDNVWPWQMGIPKSPIFLFRPSYWRPVVQKSLKIETVSSSPKLSGDRRMFESEPRDLCAKIQLKNVTKIYSGSGETRMAVNDLSLNIYAHQITVLLGHNGAGKTTTMNMITGMFDATNGEIRVNGYNVRTNTNEARRSMGLCSQDNVYFNELTLAQHLRLFAMLKNYPSACIESEVVNTIQMLGLQAKTNELATKLSGGMKRKLALGMALVGETDTLILDEPTSGLDPDARRTIWDLLLRIRRQRTILITTHYMEEADVLGDRIAILRDGQLCCVGSPFYLKSALGTGYRLRIAKQSSSSNFDSTKFSTILRRYIPMATLCSEVETEVIYCLEQEQQQTPTNKENQITDNNNNNNNDKKLIKKNLITSLIALFDMIEQHKSEYGISSCGLSYATLEDVFLTVGSTNAGNSSDDNNLMLTNDEYSASSLMNTIVKFDNDEKQIKLNLTKLDQLDDNANPLLLLCKQHELYSGTTLLAHQTMALLLKRFHFARRYWPMFIFQLFLPTLVIALAMMIQNSTTTSVNSQLVKNLVLELNARKIYGSDTKLFFYDDEDNDSDQLFDQYEKLNEYRYDANVTRIPIRPQNDTLHYIAKWILNSVVGDNQLNKYIRKHLYGLGVPPIINKKQTYQIWVNFEQYHSYPLAINALYETLLRSIVPPALQSNVSIVVQNAPILRDTDRDTFNTLSILLPWALTCLLFFPIAFPFLASSYILYPIKEYQTKSKLLQLMTGLSPTLFWCCNFLFDLLIHLLAVTILYLIIVIFDYQHLIFGPHSKTSAAFLFTLLFTFGMSTIAVVYALSFRFKSSSSGFVFHVIVCFLIGFIGNLVMSVLNLLEFFFGATFINTKIYGIALNIFRIVPIFSLLFGYQKVHLLTSMSKFCTSLTKQQLFEMCQTITKDNIFLGCCEEKCGTKCYLSGDAFSFDQYGSGWEMIYLAATGLICFVTIILYDTYKLSITKCLQNMFTTNIFVPNSQVEDEDVVQERKLIEQDLQRNCGSGDYVDGDNRQFGVPKSPLSNLLTVVRLIKKYTSKNSALINAVDGLTFGVRHNECFGLLGVNGAGKTTTFSMLTGDLFPSSGNAYISSPSRSLSLDAGDRGGYLYSLIHNMGSFQRKIGYCPQFDALLDRLTGEETLYFFARLRGVPRNLIDRDVRNLICMVGLEPHANKRIEHYSGGNRRKLSLAVALVGNPLVMFLDEPSAGVDPVARRKIWQTLGYVKRHLNTSIVLTSHSMEECEALCSRIGIMVNGQFQCMGSTQHLRSKFGQGYTIIISLSKSTESDQTYMQTVHNAIVQTIPSASLKDSHQSLMHYHIADPTERWSNLFRQMSQLDEQFGFENYTISDTTLEQIFIMFARHQRPLLQANNNFVAPMFPTTTTTNGI